MSLLNKMLADLETRAAESQQQSVTAPVLAGLRAVNEERPLTGSRRGLWVLLLTAALVFAGMRVYPLVQARWQPPAASSAESNPAAAQGAARSAHAADEATDSEHVHSSAAQALIDEKRPMATTEFVAVPLPPVLGSLDVAEEPEWADPLEPAPHLALPQETLPSVPGQTVPPTQLSIVQPPEPTGARRVESAPRPMSKVAVAAATIAAIEDIPEEQRIAMQDAQDDPPLSAPAPAPKREFTSSAESALVKAPQQLSPQESAQEAHLNALQLLSEGRLTEAEARWRSSLRLHPAHLDARVALAGLLRDQERSQEAQSLLEDGLTVSPGAGMLRQWLARLYLEHGFTERAVAVLESGRPFAQQDGEYLAVLAAFYQQAGNFKAAADAYRQALTRDAQQGRWWMGLGLALDSDGQPVVAAQAYERALGTSGLPRELVPFTRARLAAARQDPR